MHWPSACLALYCMQFCGVPPTLAACMYCPSHTGEGISCSCAAPQGLVPGQHLKTPSLMTVTWMQDVEAKHEEEDAERLAEAAAAKSTPKDEVQLKKPAGESCCHQHSRPLLLPVTLMGRCRRLLVLPMSMLRKQALCDESWDGQPFVHCTALVGSVSQCYVRQLHPP